MREIEQMTERPRASGSTPPVRYTTGKIYKIINIRKQTIKMCEDVVSLWGKEEEKATCRRAETLVLNIVLFL